MILYNYVIHQNSFESTKIFFLSFLVHVFNSYVHSCLRTKPKLILSYTGDQVLVIIKVLKPGVLEGRGNRGRLGRFSNTLRLLPKVFNRGIQDSAQRSSMSLGTRSVHQ